MRKSSSSEAAWQEELCAAALPDQRLFGRRQRLLDQMSAARSLFTRPAP